VKLDCIQKKLKKKKKNPIHSFVIRPGKDETLNISKLLRFCRFSSYFFLCPFVFLFFDLSVMHHLVWTLSFTHCYVSIVLMKLSHLFVLGWSDFWLDSLIQFSIAQGDQVNISAIHEVLIRHQSLAYKATLSNGTMDLCLEMFQEYQAIMDWVAKTYPNVVEVRLWHKRMLTKWRKSKRNCPNPSSTQWKVIHMHGVTSHEVKCSDVLS